MRERDREKIEADIVEYLSSGRTFLETDGSTMMVRASLDALRLHGITGGVSPEQLLEQLPPLSDIKLDFARRYATEPRRLFKDWAEEFSVTVWSISKWLSDAAVQAHIAAYRAERHSYNMAVWLSMQQMAMDTLKRVLQLRATGSNADSLASTAFKVLEYSKKLFQVSDGNGNVVDATKQPVFNPEKVKAEVVWTDDDIQRMKEEIEEMEQLKERAMRVRSQRGIDD